ncbi:DUF4142 domain-containing protein [Bordetella bronchiseptica]|uniref:DUF4142 domain-containing protein n=1 Tax=Bordetella bronchiseptica TaxID=518 RepID=UPI0002902BDC|nr:DUF4142 domain-containing protein [Bordetella bronchiseptica]KAK50903.1 PF13628 domain protein [Bordetella bronchiseptica OSU054]KAK68461.1 PF13628 domain protein [Bordetella bronchiseptica MO211]KCV55895.1 PF13628 domain protein [Bordetella bronchiseptica 7E71]KDB77755.1 PF13628 domain protein [Bordetella bronchiseptica CA90 BB1334]KDC18327.1 PF13628 domain protein [Bordetella bronchiseptica E014]
MKSLFITGAACMAVGLAAAGAVQAQTQTQTQPPPVSPAAGVDKLDSADRDFLEDAAQAGHLEVEGSKLALEKARATQVKDFAQKMIDDHTKVGVQLDTLARSKGYQAPAEPSLVQKAKLQALSLRDEGFDKAYADEIGVAAHEDAVELFTKAAGEAKDPDVKQFAATTLESLKAHLEMARTLQQAVAPAKP